MGEHPAAAGINRWCRAAPGMGIRTEPRRPQLPPAGAVSLWAFADEIGMISKPSWTKTVRTKTQLSFDYAKEEEEDTGQGL